MNQRLCRIGVFYDGSYFCKAQNHYWHERKLGWLKLENFQAFVERHVRSVETPFSGHKIVYSAWFQGRHAARNATLEQLRKDREQDDDLMHAKVHPHFLHMGARSGREKGVDVELALDAYSTVRDGNIDVAVLVTGDGDMVPLARRILKHDARVLVAHFSYKGLKDRAYTNARLCREGTYVLNISSLESRAETAAEFRSLFRTRARGRRPSAHLGGTPRTGLLQ